MKLLPVFRMLIQRGFGGTAAIDWLIEQGEVGKEDRKRAFFALRRALNRCHERERSAPFATANLHVTSRREPSPASSHQF